MSARNDLNAWLDWAENQHSDEICPGLERVHAVAQQLDLLTPQATVITVAGTNGKGSCVAFLESIYHAAGLKVGSFTSPHFLHYNERIRLNSGEASDEALIAAFAAVFNALEHSQIKLTFFEINILIALSVFQHCEPKLDVILLEVGLGGRLDAVNIIDADVAVVSSIALDHEAWLGDTREAIGSEKAGIFRANRPAVCGDANPPQSLIAQAEKLGAPLQIQNRDFGADLIVQDQNKQWTFWCAGFELQQLPVSKLALDNAATALQVIQLLQEQLPVNRQAVIAGLQTAQLTGRFQIITDSMRQTEIILDVAHNPAAAQRLAVQLKARPCMGKTWGLFAVMADKDIAGITEPLLPVIHHWSVAALEQARAEYPETLCHILNQQGTMLFNQNCFQSVEQAYQAVKLKMQPGDRLVIFGSFWTIAALLPLLD